jgi:hypothetical protein
MPVPALIWPVSIVSTAEHEGPRAAADHPPVLLSAAVVSASGVSCLLVGSGALRLRGEPITVHDADLVIEPGEPNLRRLRAVLTELAVRPRLLPAEWRLSALDMVTVPTSYGTIDCLLERGRLDWRRLRASAGMISVAGVGVLVAGKTDAWHLRRRFKECGSG